MRIKKYENIKAYKLFLFIVECCILSFLIISRQI